MRYFICVWKNSEHTNRWNGKSEMKELALAILNNKAIAMCGSTYFGHLIGPVV
ncbi:MAG: hypothetical protein ACKVOR_04345 [Flavobacteriales bacterium]